VAGRFVEVPSFQPCTVAGSPRALRGAMERQLETIANARDILAAVGGGVRRMSDHALGALLFSQKGGTTQ
jgi:hypothetical protein